LILISESWLSPKIGNGLLDPKSLFQIYRKDRIDGYGGVCIFVDKLINSVPISADFNGRGVVELVGCSIIIDKLNLYVFCFYCAPKISSEEFSISLEALRSLLLISKDHLIFGDFNLPSIDWRSDWDNPVFPNEPRPQAFQLFCLDMGLIQINHYPTRKDAVLDLILVNDPMIVSELNWGVPLGRSDHDSLSLVIFLPTNNSAVVPNNVAHPNWSLTNWDGYSDFCSSVAWSSFFSLCWNANDCWNMFKNFITHGNSLFVPLISKSNVRSNFTSCLGQKSNRTISNLENKKKALWKRLKLNPTNQNRDTYKFCVKQIKKAQLNLEFSRERKILESGNLGVLYKHINSRLAHKSGVAPLIDNQGNLLHNEKDKANLLNMHFVNAW